MRIGRVVIERGDPALLAIRHRRARRLADGSFTTDPDPPPAAFLQKYHPGSTPHILSWPQPDARPHRECIEVDSVARADHKDSWFLPPCHMEVTDEWGNLVPVHGQSCIEVVLQQLPGPGAAVRPGGVRGAGAGAGMTGAGSAAAGMGPAAGQGGSSGSAGGATAAGAGACMAAAAASSAMEEGDGEGGGELGGAGAPSWVLRRVFACRAPFWNTPARDDGACKVRGGRVWSWDFVFNIRVCCGE